ncbi:Protein of unknown function [Anaerosphaera aminiphila DSM 21120]|uniref:DUF2812 domain-containing protein n=1 Tax=Anaerosphaera aminiphila DSM 21120 TaxID=1120995 RepID=A0A1M5PSN0_9FIRM|nr:DUF2812 domain-containing protein [Anaerosphaera aminiphila]SHH04283.1 Protein of unknown function [Anaerosphaera aminiphila DSM 21120]
MKKFHIFLNPIESREGWLNKVAKNGYKLKYVYGGLIYEFEKADNAVKYAVQYIGNMNNVKRVNYENFLSEMNYSVWSVPLNLGSLSIGRFKWRPYATVGGQITTSSGMINREILIIEKISSEENFKLFTSVESNLSDLKFRRRINIYLFIISLLTMFYGYSTMENTLLKSIVTTLLIILFLVSIFNIVKLSNLITSLKKDGKIIE